LREIRAFFESCERGDPGYRFAFTSKVLLAIPRWGELQRRFAQRAEARLAGTALPPLAGGAVHPASSPTLRARGRFLRTLARVLMLRTPARSPEVLLFTLAGGAGAAGRDAYFGALADQLGASRTFTVYLAAGKGLSLPSDERRAPLEAFARAGDAVAAWRDGLHARLDPVPGEPEHALLAEELAAAERGAGEAFLHAFMRRTFTRMLTILKPRVLVFPFENRAWEKSLLAAARAAGVPRTVGFQHSSITPRHLGFEIAAASAQLPDCVITVGGVTADWLRRVAPPLTSRLVVGASLRRGTAPIALPAAHGVLVAVSSSRDEAQALMRAVHEAATATNLPIVIRSHPTIRADDLFARFDWPANVRLSQGTTLEQDLAVATMVGYSSSTVALEGMLHGRLPLFIDIGDVPDADPLVGDCPGKRAVDSGAALAAAMAGVSGLPAGEIEAQRAAAKAYAEAYLRDPTADRSREIEAAILGREPAP